MNKKTINLIITFLSLLAFSSCDTLIIKSDDLLISSLSEILSSEESNHEEVVFRLSINIENINVRVGETHKIIVNLENLSDEDTTIILIQSHGDEELIDTIWTAVHPYNQKISWAYTLVQITPVSKTTIFKNQIITLEVEHYFDEVGKFGIESAFFFCEEDDEFQENVKFVYSEIREVIVEE